MILSKVSLGHDPEAHEMKAFHCKGSQAKVHCIVFMETKCSRFFCNNQNINQYTSKACGCFSQKLSRSNIASTKTIVFGIDAGKKQWESSVQCSFSPYLQRILVIKITNLIFLNFLYFGLTISKRSKLSQ